MTEIITHEYKDKKALFIECDCCSHILGLNYLVEDDFPPSLDLSLYVYGYRGNKMSWLYRIKAAWFVLTTGEPYTDQLTVNGADKIQKIKDWFATL